MNKRNAVCVAFLALLFLSACSSDVKKPQPSGEWKDVNSSVVNIKERGK